VHHSLTLCGYRTNGGRQSKRRPRCLRGRALVVVCTLQIAPDLDAIEASASDTRTNQLMFCCTPRSNSMRFFDVSDDLLFGAALAFVIAVVLALV
jgi:hypothetical protein